MSGYQWYVVANIIYRVFVALVRRVCWKIKMSTNNGRPSSPQLISFDNEDVDGFEDNFGKNVS